MMKENGEEICVLQEVTQEETGKEGGKPGQKPKQFKLKRSTLSKDVEGGKRLRRKTCAYNPDDVALVVAVKQETNKVASAAAKKQTEESEGDSGGNVDAFK